MAEALLYLAHRIPFPPNKGDKIRSFHLLRHLSQRYRIFLAAFIDDEHDWRYTDDVKRLCADCHFQRISPMAARLKSLAGLMTGEPLSLPYYRSRPMATWVRNVLKRENIGRVVAFSSPMGQYAMNVADAIRVMDFVDVDSDKWRQYAAGKTGPAGWVYRREARRLLAFEQDVARAFDASLFVSEHEAALFRTLAPESARKIDYFNNGVDARYFDPADSHPNPYADGEDTIVFTGAMDYWPNIDAVTWFADNVFAGLQQQYPKARFCIVGARPAKGVLALAQRPGIRVTGAVQDIRPYLAHARFAVAPLRIARGVQNKVLEAMSMGKAVIVSPQGLEGISALPGKEVILAHDATGFAAATAALLASVPPDMGPAARARVQTDYDWDRNLARVDATLGGKDLVPSAGFVGTSSLEQGHAG
jgi:sugar transferase (PEP-CTERM/EpsH1 system associated)